MEFKFGDEPYPSKIIVEEYGNCIDLTFENTFTPSLSSYVFEYKDHVIRFLGVGGSKPDSFSVLSPLGWEYVTDRIVVVQEWASGVITVCQYLTS